MADIDSLIARVEDPALREALTAAAAGLRSRKNFGLVFEDHIPERVLLPDHPVRRGVRVARRDDGHGDLYFVAKVANGTATMAKLNDGAEPEEAPVGELSVIAEFGEPVYPGIRELGPVERGGTGRPAHVVVKGENHHVLEALLFSHTGRVDCIYIDPPYNSRARDWKYNNDYVDPDDDYRHSKWLAFMERRLKLAKELLNPADSVLIVAIDEKEYLRLGLLLEQCSAVRSSRW